MSGQIPRDSLIRDLSAVLAGALHQSMETAPGRVPARRIQGVLGIPDGARPKEVEKLLRAVLADDVQRADAVNAFFGDMASRDPQELDRLRSEAWEER